MVAVASIRWDLTQDEYHSFISYIDQSPEYDNARDWVWANGLDVDFDNNMYGTIIGNEDKINWLKLHL
jgi:hypothetical protein